MALARVQYTSIGFGFGRGRPCSPIMMRLQNVRKTHQLGYNAKSAERSAGGAPRCRETVDRTDDVESHGVRIRIRQFRNLGCAKESGGASVRAESTRVGIGSQSGLWVLCRPRREGFGRGYFSNHQHQRSVFLRVSNAL